MFFCRDAGLGYRNQSAVEATRCGTFHFNIRSSVLRGCNLSCRLFMSFMSSYLFAHFPTTFRGLWETNQHIIRWVAVKYRSDMASGDTPSIPTAAHATSSASPAQLLSHRKPLLLHSILHTCQDTRISFSLPYAEVFGCSVVLNSQSTSSFQNS